MICEACSVYGNVHCRMEAVLAQRLFFVFLEENDQTLNGMNFGLTAACEKLQRFSLLGFKRHADNNMRPRCFCLDSC